MITVVRRKLERGWGSAEERRQADLFFAELMGGAARPARSREAEGAEQWSRSSVFNPGDSHWQLVSSNRPSLIQAFSAGAIRRGTTYADYDGWESIRLDHKYTDAGLGIEVDIESGAQAKGVLRSTGVGTYVRDAWVEAKLVKVSGVIDATVGWSKPFKWVKASWDFDWECARLDLPIEIVVQHGGAKTIRQTTITYWGNGERRIDYARASP